MVITVKDEYREITLSQDDIERWTEMVEVFMDALKGLGYHVKPFHFDGNTVEVEHE